MTADDTVRTLAALAARYNNAAKERDEALAQLSEWREAWNEVVAYLLAIESALTAKPEASQ